MCAPIRTRPTIVLAILIAGLCANTSSAQTPNVTGVVTDARTGRALAGVLVSIDGQPVFVETDVQGRFALSLSAGEHVMAVSFVGYALLRQSIDVPAQGVLPLTILLSEGAGTFAEHVTVSGANLPDTERGPAGTLLHGRELQALRGVTLDDPMRALHALPSATATDDFDSEFAVRGSPFRQVGLSVDGIPSRYLMHAVHGVTDGGSIAMINSDAVGSLSLLPGSYPQRMGRHLGAQVDVLTRDGNRDAFRARAGLSGTSATTLLEGPLAGKRGSWLVSARRSYLDLLLDRLDDQGNFAFGFTDVEAKLVFDLTPRHQIQLLSIAGASAFDEDPADLGVNDEATVDGRSWLSGLSWRFVSSDRLAVTQRVYATGLAYKNRNKTRDLLDDSRSTDVGWRADGRAALRPGMVLLEFGGDVVRLTGRHARQRSLGDAPGLTLVSDYHRNGHVASAYAQAVIGRPSRFTVTPGARIDHWSPGRVSTTSPWVIVNAPIVNGTRLRAGGGLYRQFADFEQTSGVHAGGLRLRPETARHIDLGVSQQLPLDMELQITGYARDESDVSWTPNAEPRRLADGTIQLGRGDAPWINALDGRARGLELVLRRDAASGLSGWAGYAYGRHEYTDVTSSAAFWSDNDQRHSLSLFGHYRLSNRTTVGAKFRYGSNYPLVGYIGEEPFSPNAPPLFGGEQPLFFGLTESRNRLRLPAYARLDARADRTFTWLKRRVTLFVEVANVLNRRNVRNVPYDVNRFGRVLGPTDSLMPILPSAGFAIEF